MTASTETTGRGAGSSLSAWRQSKKARFRIILAFKYLIAAIVLVYSLFPILWTISASFSPSGSISGQTLIPSPPTLRNYERILDQDFWLWMRNSFIISSISALLVGLITLMSAYAFSRFRWKGRSQLLLMILLIQVFPAILAMVALFAILQQIGNYIPFLGLNTHGGLILIYMGGALGVNVWLMKG
ncbi:MAG TPA: sugar ABC transporter permease, partial [Promineifilum sp.]|nr:sugar ABC transporter permease [Promineifilum sp.]